MTLCAGLDVGSLYLKAALLEDGDLVGTKTGLAGTDAGVTMARLLDELLDEAGHSRDELQAVVATGAGRGGLPFVTSEVNEVVAAARGAPYFRAEVRGVIDLGGESTRIVKLDEKGEVQEYTQNEKCASGTGIFLDAMAKVMDLSVEEMGPRSLESTTDIDITSTCVAFAESEVVSLVHSQTPMEDILRGMHRSIATRVFGMVHRVDLTGPTMAIGGLARNIGVVRSLEEMMGEELVLPSQPQVVSATGAGLIAADKESSQ
jgi:predicted CoA-substrate-specific enzyme activase